MAETDIGAWYNNIPFFTKWSVLFKLTFYKFLMVDTEELDASRKSKV